MRASGQERFARQHARTQRFTLGHPRSFAIAPDGGRVTFLRARAGDDPVHALWALDIADGVERCVCDPASLEGADEPGVPPQERARRERLREQGSGIVAYGADRALRLAAFALGGRLMICDVDAGRSRALPIDGAVIDPRPDPLGRLVAYVRAGALEVAGLGSLGATGRTLAGEEDPDVSWGLAEFIAAEEMGRARGFWWSPDGQRLAVARVDSSKVGLWHIADPAEPAKAPTPIRYPAAGTANADVTLWIADLNGARVQAEWDRELFPYLARVVWGAHGPLTAMVQSRDQRTMRTLSIHPISGETELVREDRDEHWIDIVPGFPRWLPDGRLLHPLHVGGTQRIAADGQAITGEQLHVRRLLHADAQRVLFIASADDPTQIDVWEASFEGDGARRLTAGSGVHGATAGGSLLIVQSRSLEHSGLRTQVRAPDGDERTLRSVAETPSITPSVELLELGERRLRAALVLPQGHQPSHRPRLPVLLDPYGGPHVQRVARSSDLFLVPQWFADAGMAVLVVDGRGTPGRGSEWERAVAGDLAGPPLEDQLAALDDLAARRDDLDLSRVAIRGWSFGGFLAALALLRRPDRILAAIAGAPVTDWRLYDTHYTERYLGTPEEQPEAYRRSSLLDDAREPGGHDDDRALLLIHGLADDNVVAAHTLRLSRALLDAGREHQMLPLSGVTHMSPLQLTAARLLEFQLGFLRGALGLEVTSTDVSDTAAR